MEHNFNFDRCSTENPFSVPEGYFEDFCRRMEVLTTPKKISLLQRIRPYWYAAAMVVLILSIGVFFFQSRKIEEQNKQKMAEIEYNNAMNKILVDETNEDMIVDYILAGTD